MLFKIDNCDKKINSDLPILRLGKVNQLMRSDIYESDNEYIINIDVPGFSKEDIKELYAQADRKMYAQKREMHASK